MKMSRMIKTSKGHITQCKGAPTAKAQENWEYSYVQCQMANRLIGVSLCEVYKCLIIMLFGTPETN